MKKPEIMENKQWSPRYSGNKSKVFWKRVNKLRKGDWQEMFSLGVALQNMEQYVLKQLAQAEEQPVRYKNK